jgi:hypothetical protein
LLDEAVVVEFAIELDGREDGAGDGICDFGIDFCDGLQMLFLLLLGPDDELL